MCGHVGIAGKLETRDEATMKRLLIFDYFRGPDSTGFAALRNDGTHQVVKIASNPVDLFDTTKFIKALSGYNSSVFLGHNRYATKGVVNNVNAHPYEYGDIIGAHNGTLDMPAWKELERELKEEFPVDSMAIIAGIDRLGIEKTVSLLRGAWALVWIDKKDGTLNFLRNKERPFWFSYAKSMDKLMWASEWPMIEAATKLSTSTYDLYTDKDGFGYWETTVDTWYKFDIKALATTKTVYKPVIRTVKGKEPAPVTTYVHGQGNFPRAQQASTTQGSSSSSTGTASTSTSMTTIGSTTGRTTGSADNIVHLTGTNTQPFGGFLTKEEFDELAKYGCSWCTADVEFDEPGLMVDTHRGSVLCPDCATHEEGVNRVYAQEIHAA